MNLSSITATYPGFQSLPKGVKQMLLVSESVFFDEARPVQKSIRTATAAGGPHPVRVAVWPEETLLPPVEHIDAV
jgi:hypothetical protein